MNDQNSSETYVTPDVEVLGSHVDVVQRNRVFGTLDGVIFGVGQFGQS